MMPEIPLSTRVEDELLPRVRHPAQYIGREVNQLVRDGDWAGADLRVAIGFPDSYALGMSHLGCQILYWIANHQPGVCAERVYCPEPDAEQVLRERALPLFTWDTRQPVRSADVLAISLQHELSFLHLLNMLDLAGVPLRYDQRGDDDPLVLVGGPQADNVEPVAEFVDLAIIGDGEDCFPLLLDALREAKRARPRLPRIELVATLAERFAWLYAPNLYAVHYNDDGTLREVEPTRPGLPARIERCRVHDFERAPVPLRPLVPWTPAVHERIAIEILRGCPHLCRFCHAGHTKRPLAWRSVERIVALAEQVYKATGYDEIGLLSLSTSDYPQLGTLAERLNERFAPRRVNLSFPSLRVDVMLRHVPRLGGAVRKAGLTLAVEAARDDLRRALRKKVTDGDLFDGVRAAYEAGWGRIKLYFMVGFPGETAEDIDGIFELSYALAQERRKLGKAPAAVTAAVSWLVPKPFTPLQWNAQPRREYFESVRDRLRGLARKCRSTVHLRLPRADRAVVEAVLARGDRRLGAAIEHCWRNGARFDARDELFRFERWQAAFAATGIDPDFYAHRERPHEERLPWDHIGLHLGRAFLERGHRDLEPCLRAAVSAAKD